MHKGISDLNDIIDKYGWFKVMLWLSQVADEQGHDDLYRELENIAVNHVPEVK